jgi:histone demethylase JARID1
VSSATNGRSKNPTPNRHNANIPPRYHGKCLKIARGKVKDDDKYTCPICDWRVKIPRDAARPKLEDLHNWQDDITNLPFQPEEEECLASIIDTAQQFRNFIEPYINPVMTTPEEVHTQRFWLRKIEGAEILLVKETNFFKQELHRWSPVAPEPPPILENSLSTRKPRPTKQQKLMASLGIDNPDDLPPHLRTRTHSTAKRKSNEPTTGRPLPLQPAPGRDGSPSSQAQSSLNNTIISSTETGLHNSIQRPFGNPTPGESEYARARNPVWNEMISGRDDSSPEVPGDFAFPMDQMPAHEWEPDRPLVESDGDEIIGEETLQYRPPNMDRIFEEMTNQESDDALEGSHANEALAMTAAAKEDDDEADKDPDGRMTED